MANTVRLRAGIVILYFCLTLDLQLSDKMCVRCEQLSGLRAAYEPATLVKCLLI